MKTKTLNKNAITKEIIAVLNWYNHIKVLYSGEFHVKQSFLICQHFSSCLQRLSYHVTCVTIICVTKFKLEFQKYKAGKCNTFYQRKRDFN